MTEHGMMFAGDLVRAILAGQKTETRRLLAPSTVFVLDNETGKRARRPEGFADLLARSRGLSRFGPPVINLPAHHHLVVVPRVQAGDVLWVRETWASLGAKPAPGSRVVYRADTDGERVRVDAPWRPAVHLPRWACRLTLPVVEVRVERLHDIDDAGAAAEGVSGGAEAFGRLWRDLYGAESWNANPLVLVYRWEPVGGER